MKKSNKVAMALAATVGMSVATPVLAADIVMMELEVAPINIYEDANPNVAQLITGYLSISGEVVSVDPLNFGTQAEDGHYLVRIVGETGEASLLMDNYTLIWGEQHIEVGDVVTGFYSAGGIAPMIYPPQHAVRFVVNSEEVANVKVDRFNEVLVSSDGMLSLNLSEEVEITMQGGEAYDEATHGALADRLLVVEYDVTTRSIPAQTTPIRVVVLNEREMAVEETVTVIAEPAITYPNDTVSFTEDDVTFIALHGGSPIPELMPTPAAPVYNPLDSMVVVNGAVLPGIHAEVVGDLIFPSHVQLRPVIEAIGTELNWDYATNRVTLSGYNGEISFVPGESNFIVNGQVVSLLQPSVVMNDRTYVPLSFFRQVFGMNNAYFEGGNVHIDNFEIMN